MIQYCKWAKIIAARYMGNDKAEEYGRRNNSEEELLIKIKPTKVIGQKDIVGWLIINSFFIKNLFILN